MGFFITAGFLGIMYYFVPKQAERPVYSYRLSIVHFWALITVYIWAGPHHLHYTALPDWAQSLGMVMSLILLAPSWGGMINGMMTLSGAWHKLRSDPILRFLVVSLAFYGMSTFEGLMMAIKTVNALSHYTDWTIGHVHAGALGWVAMVSIGALYHLIPKAFGRAQMHSIGLLNAHFWVATIGTVLYIASMCLCATVRMGRQWLPESGGQRMALGGGDAETIKASILHGRVAAMPAWGQVTGEEGAKNVAAYVRSDLAGLPLPEGTVANNAAGGQVYAETCSVCHGANGEGMAAMGAPKLTSSAGWIYGSTMPQSQQTIRYGRNGQMPAQEQYLGNDKVHLLAAYVYSLSQQPERLAK